MSGERTLRDLAAAIAVELGEGWGLEASGERWESSESIKRADGAAIRLAGADGRVRIHGSAGCADFSIGTGFGRVPCPTITVAASRPTAAIWREISRRFLPQFLAAVEEAKSKQASHDERVHAAREVGEELARILGDEVRHHRGSAGGEVYALGCAIRVELVNVSFQLHSAEPELALRLARVVAEYEAETAPMRASA